MFTNKTSKHNKVKTRQLLVMTIPGILFLLVFNYLPLPGLILAFKNYRYDLGILGSHWIGFKNFEFFFKSTFASMVTRNTLGYNLVFITSTLIGSLMVALLLNEVKSRKGIKFYQTVFFFPYFLAWPVIAFMTFALFNMDLGLLNQWIAGFGGRPVNWYANPSPWIIIMPLLNFWKVFGYNTLLIYATIIGIDKTYYEAAMIDGAGKSHIKWRRGIGQRWGHIGIGNISGIFSNLFSANGIGSNQAHRSVLFG